MLFLLLALNVLAFRLGPDAELKAELRRRAAESQIQAGCVVTCVGSLTGIGAGTTKVKFFTDEGAYCILSLWLD